MRSKDFIKWRELEGKLINIEIRKIRFVSLDRSYLKFIQLVVRKDIYFGLMKVGVV